MKIMDIVNYGNSILNKKCSPVSDFSDIKLVIEKMFDSMYEAEGIGLAANQVGLDLNLFIIDITHTEEAEKPHVFINSEILSFHGQKTFFQEGCLSLPGIALDVERPEKVVLKYQTVDQEWHEDEFEGLLSRAIQHEMDHLNGIFIVDRVSKIEKIKYKNELKKLVANSKYSQKNKNNFVI